MQLFILRSTSRRIDSYAVCNIIILVVIFFFGEIQTRRPPYHYDHHHHRFGPPRRNYRGAVVANGKGCADVGINIMKKGGNAVDVAIATLLCEGITMPSTMGLGGGFFMSIFDKSSGEVISLDARETAPADAYQDMFSGNSTLARAGGLSVAVPGELRGYWEAYNKYGGGVPWKELFRNPIKQCRFGIYVNKFIAKVMATNRDILYADPAMRSVFINKVTNGTYKEGEYYRNMALAKTLDIIAREGGDALHNGSLTANFVNDIQAKNGIITVEDMNQYSPKWKNPIETTLFNGISMYSFPLPGSGPIVSYIMNILDGFLDSSNHTSVTNYQRLVESLKFGYGARTQLGDDDFVDLDEYLNQLILQSYAEETRGRIFDNITFQDPEYYGAYSGNVEDHGTSHICVLAQNGDAVSVTSSINYVFGAKFMSESTGIILNDSMDDFSLPGETNQFGLPPSPTNYIVPNKRPMSSMTPVIFLDSNREVVMITGGAGGSKIISNVIQVMVNHLLYGMDLKSSIDAIRLHHQLIPMILTFESEFMTQAPNVVEYLQHVGHNITFNAADGFASITAISRDARLGVTGAADRRRLGDVAYI
ncbi:unnamed protein product [Phaedon cochleariae]|uniref:Uncharacterized protein n=1 Tax=Phaedon cochleariae TaxID=80249 RepID=A0A9N9SKD0_PHACE|nr:unnamed protein product [Phaedon cochleariae]